MSADHAACRYTIPKISATSAYVRTKCVLLCSFYLNTCSMPDRFRTGVSSLESGIYSVRYCKAFSIREAPSKWGFNDKWSTTLGGWQSFLTRSSNERSPSYLVLTNRKSSIVSFTISCARSCAFISFSIPAQRNHPRRESSEEREYLPLKALMPATTYITNQGGEVVLLTPVLPAAKAIPTHAEKVVLLNAVQLPRGSCRLRRRTKTLLWVSRRRWCDRWREKVEIRGMAHSSKWVCRRRRRNGLPRLQCGRSGRRRNSFRKWLSGVEWRTFRRCSSSKSCNFSSLICKSLHTSCTHWC